MRTCEFCSALVDGASNKCTGCGATQSTVAPSAPVASMGGTVTPTSGAVAQTKPKGSWGCLIALLIVFWPAAIVYYLTKSWK